MGVIVIPLLGAIVRMVLVPEVIVVVFWVHCAPIDNHQHVALGAIVVITVLKFVTLTTPTLVLTAVWALDELLIA
jgi:hypothetical protein